MSHLAAPSRPGPAAPHLPGAARPLPTPRAPGPLDPAHESVRVDLAPLAPTTPLLLIVHAGLDAPLIAHAKRAIRGHAADEPARSILKHLRRGGAVCQLTLSLPPQAADREALLTLMQQAARHHDLRLLGSPVGHPKLWSSLLEYLLDEDERGQDAP